MDFQFSGLKTISLSTGYFLGLALHGLLQNNTSKRPVGRTDSTVQFLISPKKTYRFSDDTFLQYVKFSVLSLPRVKLN